MAVLKIYAGNSASSLVLLPSPVSLKPSHEQIWSENTGRAQSGANRAKMIGDVVAQKKTYAIQWGVLTETEFNTIKNNLKAGFFYFAVGVTAQEAQNSASKFYRGDMNYEMLQSGPSIFYKDLSVNVIEQ